MEFMRDFPDDDTCLEWLWRTRYSTDGTHAHCERCDQERAFRKYVTTQVRQSWTCTACGHHLHPTAGTIFHKSSTSLHLWFYGIYLMTSTRCGISAKQLERELGVTYKTAWRMAHLIRNELMAQDDTGTLNGEVEVDETYVGGKRRGGARGRPGADSHKTPVFGMAQRGGRVVATVVPDTKKATVMPHVRERVLPESTIYSDEYIVYSDLAGEGYTHRRVHHAAKVWVSGTAHTNTIEGFWALLKNGLRGVYHAVSAKHLQGYLNEYAWRYNLRDDERSMFLTCILKAASG